MAFTKDFTPKPYEPKAIETEYKRQGRTFSFRLPPVKTAEDPYGIETLTEEVWSTKVLPALQLLKDHAFTMRYYEGAKEGRRGFLTYPGKKHLYKPFENFTSKNGLEDFDPEIKVIPKDSIARSLFVQSLTSKRDIIAEFNEYKPMRQLSAGAMDLEISGESGTKILDIMFIYTPDGVESRMDIKEQYGKIDWTMYKGYWDLYNVFRYQDFYGYKVVNLGREGALHKLATYLQTIAPADTGAQWSAEAKRPVPMPPFTKEALDKALMPSMTQSTTQGISQQVVSEPVNTPAQQPAVDSNNMDDIAF